MNHFMFCNALLYCPVRRCIMLGCIALAPFCCFVLGCVVLHCAVLLCALLCCQKAETEALAIAAKEKVKKAALEAAKAAEEHQRLLVQHQQAEEH